ncbi:hypothetical protein VT85_16245 [Planctomyces sp. SH-PL62]|nr:hypothetical protein VT85_16245 [Planctomyces sp. SH-PL62]
MPGGHAAVVDDLADHRRVLAGLVVGQERERRRLLGAVAGLALLLDDRGGGRGVGDRAEVFDLRLHRLACVADLLRGGADAGDVRLRGGPGSRLLDKAAGDRRGGDLDRPTGDEGVERLAKMLPLRGRLARADAVLVVDRASVADRGPAVEHEDLGGALGQGGIGHHVVAILQNGEVDLELAGVGGDLLDGVAGVGIDAEEHDPLGPELLVQLDEAGEVQVADRALRAHEDEDRPGLARESEEAVVAPGQDVLQCEVGHPLPDEAVDGQRRGGLVEGGGGGRREGGGDREEGPRLDPYGTQHGRLPRYVESGPRPGKMRSRIAGNALVRNRNSL